MQRRSRLEIESGGVWVRVPIKTVCLSVFEPYARDASLCARGARIIRERRDAVRIPRAARVFLQYKRDLILYKLDCGPYGSCQEKGSIPYVVDGADDSSCTRLVRVNQLVRVRTRSCVH